MSTTEASDLIEAQVKTWRAKGASSNLHNFAQDIVDKNLVDDYTFIGNSVRFTPYPGSVAEIRDLARYHKVTM